jgi:PAS domain S-box-containing protein
MAKDGDLITSTIPSRDRAFRRVVERVVAEEGIASAAGLAERLRSLYPCVAVFERLLSGDQGHLYVYRDGYYKRDPAERWWDEPGVARVCVAVATGRLTYASDEWGALLGTEASALIDRHYTDFVLPDARPSAQAMFEALLEGGEVRSEALVVRGDGSPIAIEFRATREDDEIDIRYRPLR